jgi:ABC-type transport system involved in cytochrome c biogenesis ATPase subunit
MAGLKPSFLEISADMLRFVPFAQKAGMVYIGDTEGNAHRVVKDMAYLVRNSSRVRAGMIVREEAFGIVDQQVSRMNRALDLMKANGWDLDRLLQRLARSSTSGAMRDSRMFAGILSLPKPTYSAGLGAEAHAFLQHRVATLGISNGKVPKLPSSAPLKGAIRLRALTIVHTSHVRRTQKTHAVEQAFDISPDCIRHPILSDLDLDIQPGQVVLLTGSSGSGKTSVLRLLASPSRRVPRITWPATAKVGQFRPLTSNKPLIDALGLNSVETALHLMGLVGLSDAYVYLKRFGELSNGQQYRAMLARLLADGSNVWLADEFCANLDSLTANIVADRLQRVARQRGAILVVASSQPQAFAHSLAPDTVLQLTTAGGHTVSSGETFLGACSRLSLGGKLPKVSVSEEQIGLILARRPLTVLGVGRKTPKSGLVLLMSPESSVVARVEKMVEVAQKDLRAADARAAGFGTLANLRRRLSRTHPGYRNASSIAIASFVPLGSLHAQSPHS